MAFSIAATNGALAHPRLVQVSDASLCVDSMETVPTADDLGADPHRPGPAARFRSGDLHLTSPRGFLFPTSV